MTTPKPTSPQMFWGFIALMLVLMAAFLWLGNWQVHRLAEKEALIAQVDARLGRAPIMLPPTETWDDTYRERFNFRPVTMTGRFEHDQAIKVFTSLSASTARGEFSGPGYWIVTPFAVKGGGTVFVNRGFVPETQIESFEATSTPAGMITITGLARAPEEASIFTPEPDIDQRIAWVRDPDRLAELVDPDLAPFAPFTVDQAAGPPGMLPQGGETVVEFPNNHLGYAITWYGFAAVTVVMLGYWIWRQRRRAVPT